jgi:peptidoglycan hydrolase-like protein with peptidoglycan-binding domain
MASQTVIERLRAGGIVAPKTCVAEAARAGLRLELAAALLEKESAGGHNVFGHDRDGSGKYIFPARDGTVKVTKELYVEYRQRRVASGNKAMQGVGPCQLTWFSFQDEADKLGGCWKPQINMRVGFRRLATLVRTHGDSVGARMYNGSGDAAVAYSADLLKKAGVWKARLDGAVPVPSPDGPLRRGDRGPRVVRLTRRLARARSKAGAPYLANPRRELDATVEAALKAFQSERGLEPDGVYGPRSQRKLNRLLRLQQKPPETPAKPQRTGLKALVEAVHRHDAETGEAWEALVEHAVKRRRLLARLQAKGTGAAGDAALQETVAHGFAAVTAALERIDDKLDTVVAAQQDPAEAATAPTSTSAASAVADAAASAATNAAPPAVEADAASEAAPAVTIAGPDDAPSPGGGEPPAPDGATVVQAAPPAPGGATVVQAAPPAPPAPEGPAPPSPAAVPPPSRRELAELSDAELLERIERLDRALDRARAVMIRRVADVERELAAIAPKRVKERPPVAPPAKPKPVKPVVTRPTTMSRDQVTALQRALNAFTDKHLKGVGPLMADGITGPATKKRVREAKFYLGYTGAELKTIAVDATLMRRLRHPRSARASSPAMLARATSRRRKQRKAAKASMAPRPGVATFDGKPVAAWLKPYLVWARNNGWQGTLNSGWRDPAYSEQLCRQICGAPTCPGRCAGRTSNHAGNVRPAGAVDVSDYARFGELMRRCPLQPRIFNALGARDPVHFSVTGR